VNAGYQVTECRRIKLSGLEELEWGI